jgi:hypothetical protein
MGGMNNTRGKKRQIGPPQIKAFVHQEYYQEGRLKAT